VISPARFRPDDLPDVDHDGKTVDDWEDNPTSNSLAWASATFVPMWCQTPEHWSSRFASTLWTSCPCCMIFRGIAIGVIMSSIIWSVLTLLIVLALSLR
jgi:hypothetical protein